jgi:hypothetical protein
MTVVKFALWGLGILGIFQFGMHMSTPTNINVDSINNNNVTFTKNVAPILYRNCDGCHKPNDIAPMSLITYKDARPWARSIREMVVSKQMPPWGADSAAGQFANDRRLSQEEIDTIAAWVDQGSKEGDPSELPPPPASIQGWEIGQPDVVLPMPGEFTVPPDGNDWIVYFTIPTNFKEDRWIQAAEIRPGNKQLVHHATAFVVPPGQYKALKKTSKPIGDQADHESIFYQDGTITRVKADAPVIDDGCSAANGGSAFGDNSKGEGGAELGALLSGYEPGRGGDVYPAGWGKKIPAGSSIMLQMHYHTPRGASDLPEKDKTSIGLVFSKTPPSEITEMVMTSGVCNHFFKIPAGDPDHLVTACMTFDRPVRIISFMPHMHLRGKDMRYDLVFPDGRKQELLNVPRYNSNWQTVYKLEAPIPIPKGAKLIVTAHYDNSTANKFNPDPSKDIRWGDPGTDEMLVGWTEYIVDKQPVRLAAKN